MKNDMMSPNFAVLYNIDHNTKCITHFENAGPCKCRVYCYINEVRIINERIGTYLCIKNPSKKGKQVYISIIKKLISLLHTSANMHTLFEYTAVVIQSIIKMFVQSKLNKNINC